MLPEKFIAQMKNILGGEYADYIRAISAPPVRAIRINANKSSADAVLSSLPYDSEPIPYAHGGYFISSNEDDRIGSHPLHHAGAFYVQEPSAMTPACMAPIEPDFLALDVCAAPGGKSSQLAERLTRGVLVSNEIMKDRAATLLGNIERQGFDNVVVTSTDSKTLAEWFQNVFDLVL
ncbi:MAG: SAM-dependent methyltransferase, partial [Clostridia bacterium]|nr:SAM-dependent methyltransferase [Clostridia bacterium]